MAAHTGPVAANSVLRQAKMDASTSAAAAMARDPDAAVASLHAAGDMSNNDTPAAVLGAATAARKWTALGRQQCCLR